MARRPPDPLRIQVHLTSEAFDNTNDCLLEAVMRSLAYQRRGHRWARARVTVQDIVELRNELADYIEATPALMNRLHDTTADPAREIRMIRGRGNQIGQIAVMGLGFMLRERLLVLQDLSGGAHRRHELSRGWPHNYGEGALLPGADEDFTARALALNDQVPLYITHYYGAPKGKKKKDRVGADLPGHFQPVDVPLERALDDETRATRASLLVHADVAADRPIREGGGPPPPPYVIEAEVVEEAPSRKRSVTGAVKKPTKKKTKPPEELLPTVAAVEDEATTPVVDAPMPSEALPDLIPSTTVPTDPTPAPAALSHAERRAAIDARVAQRLAEKRAKHPVRLFSSRELRDLRAGMTSADFHDRWGAPRDHWYDYPNTFTNDWDGWMGAVHALDATVGIGNWDDHQFDHLVQGRESLSNWVLQTAYRVPGPGSSSSEDEGAQRFGKMARPAESSSSESDETPTGDPTPVAVTPAVEPTPLVPVAPLVIPPSPTPIVLPSPAPPALLPSPAPPIPVPAPRFVEDRPRAPYRNPNPSPPIRVEPPRPDQIREFRTALRDVFPDAVPTPQVQVPGMWRTLEGIRDRLFQRTREMYNPRQILEAAQRYAREYGPAGASAARALGEYAQAIRDQAAETAAETAHDLAHATSSVVGATMGMAVGSAETAIRSAVDARNAVVDRYEPPPPRPTPKPAAPSPPKPPATAAASSPPPKPSPKPKPAAPVVATEPVAEELIVRDDDDDTGYVPSAHTPSPKPAAPEPVPVALPLRRPWVMSPEPRGAPVAPLAIMRRHPDEVRRGILDALPRSPKPAARLPPQNPDWNPYLPSDGVLFRLPAPTPSPARRPETPAVGEHEESEHEQVARIVRSINAAKRRATQGPTRGGGRGGGGGGPRPRPRRDDSVPPLVPEDPLLTAEEGPRSGSETARDTVAGEDDGDETAMDTAAEVATDMDTALSGPEPPAPAPLYANTDRLVPAYPHVGQSRAERRAIRARMATHMPTYSGRRRTEVHLPSGTSTSDAHAELLVSRRLRRGINFSRVPGRKLRGRPRKTTTPGDLLKSKTRTRELQQDPVMSDDDVVVWTHRGEPTRGGAINRASITTYREYLEAVARYRATSEDPDLDPFNTVFLPGIRNTAQFQAFYRRDGKPMTMQKARDIRRQFTVKLRTRRRAMERVDAEDEAGGFLRDRRTEEAMMAEIMAEDEEEERKARVDRAVEEHDRERERLRVLREQEAEEARRAALLDSSSSTDPEVARRITREEQWELYGRRGNREERPVNPDALDRLGARLRGELPVMVRGRPGGRIDLTEVEPPGGIHLVGPAAAVRAVGLEPEKDSETSGSSAPPTPKPAAVPPVRRRVNVWVPGDPPKPKAKPAPAPRTTPPPLPPPITTESPSTELLPVAVVPRVREPTPVSDAMEMDDVDVGATDRVGEMPPDRLDTRIQLQALFRAIRQPFVDRGLWNLAQHLRAGGYMFADFIRDHGSTGDTGTDEYNYGHFLNARRLGLRYEPRLPPPPPRWRPDDPLPPRPPTPPE